MPTTSQKFIVKIDNECVILDSNCYGGILERKEVIGKTCFDFLHPDYHDIFRSTISQVYETGEDVEFLTQAIRVENGPYRWFENRAYATLKDGVIDAVTMVSTDITEEMEHRKAKDERERLVEDVTTTMTDFLSDLEKKFVVDTDGRIKTNGYRTLRDKITDTNEKVTKILDPKDGIFPAVQAVATRVKSLETTRRIFGWAVGAIYVALVTGTINKLFGLW